MPELHCAGCPSSNEYRWRAAAIVMLLIATLLFVVWLVVKANETDQALASTTSVSSNIDAPQVTTSTTTTTLVAVEVVPTTTTTTLPDYQCAGGSGYRHHFVRLALDALGAKQHPNACDFLLAWFQVENSGHYRNYNTHNPYGMMRTRGGLQEFATIEIGANRFAAQLDGTLKRLGITKFNYPALTSILRDAEHYPSAEAMARNENVGNDLTLWCNCEAGRDDPYKYDTIWRLRDGDY